MAKLPRVWRLCLAGAMLGLAALACDPSAGATNTKPTVTILSPEPGSSVGVGETLNVEVKAEDPDGPGVFRIDLQMDGLVVDTFEAAGPQADLGATLEVMPSKEGASTLAAIAYREDGTPSEAVTIAISVTGKDASIAEETSDEGEGASPPAAEAEVQATTLQDVEVLEEPGVGCKVIGEVPRDEVIDLLRRTTSPTAPYYETNYLGEKDLGWVLNKSLDLLADDGNLPRDPEATCLYCGDGTCSAGEDENCGTCAEDCGACAAAAPVNQPQVVSGACQAGPGACCGDGVCQSDESGSWCGDCPPEVVGTGGGGGGGNGGGGDGGQKSSGGGGDEPPPPSGGGEWGQQAPVCGDGIVEGDERCDPPGSLVRRGFCTDDCRGRRRAVCGDGVCEGPYEDCEDCAEDCPICTGGW